MSDDVIARIRTWWPLLLGHIAAGLVTWLARRFGINLDPAMATLVLGLVLSAGIWELGRRLERSDNRVADAIGRWLLALGAAVGPPSYGTKPPPTIEAGGTGFQAELAAPTSDATSRRR